MTIYGLQKKQILAIVIDNASNIISTKEKLNVCKEFKDDNDDEIDDADSVTAMMNWV